MHILWIILIGFIAAARCRTQQICARRIVGAFVATYVGQAIGWYRVDQGAGVIGAIVGALLVLFVWHRLVSTNRIGDVGGRRWL